MSEICPRCGNALRAHWVDKGIAFECLGCDYKALPKPEAYLSERKPRFPMDRI